ncbi:ComEC/Rec2 family competence protein [Paramicrobacterium agarici]|uniref:Competence protein ComEC n=1 Tax=Paramicrobacterium agarici TaxID=630514 RepID=A0A2A9DX83_9MICO|nr:ComEC/Rec2 family competence protein [Microbacterium agarici]PFG31203.1 competence protein ComEC [Microbacterium agarici]
MRLLAPAAFAWIAALLAIGLQAAFTTWAVCASVACLITVWCVVRHRGGPAALLAVSLAAAAFVSFSASLGAEQRRPDAIIDAAARDAATDIVATIDGLAQTTDRGPAHVRVKATATEVDGVAVRIPVTLFGSADRDKLAIGSSVTATGQIILTGPTDDSSALVFVDERLTVSAAPPWYLAWAHDMRRNFVDLCSSLPGAGGRLLPGLAVGDTSAVGVELDAAMKTSSLSHLTAVSGANCAIVVAFGIMLLARFGAGRLLRVTAALVVLAAFVILVTPQSSVIRASIMVSLALIVQLTGRPSGGVPALAASVVLMLAIDPWFAYDAGFALSVLATAGLLLLTRPLATALSRVLPSGISMVIAVPLAAQLACQPILILLSSSISLYGVAANILAAPAAPLATVVGLLACVVTPVVPVVATMLAWIAYLPAAWIAGVATVTSALPAATIPWIPGVLGALLLAGATCLACTFAFVPRWRTHLVGRSILACLCVCIGIYGGTVAAPALSTSLHRPRDWIVAACDIGQGDAVLLRAGGGVILVDTGPDPKLVSACLDTLGIERIDLLVLTHYDADHAGGVRGIAERTERAFVQAVHDEAGERATQELRAAGAHVEIVTAGVSGTVGNIDYSVIWPESRELTGNAGSLVLDAAIDSVDIILLGDLGEDEQRAVLSGMPATGYADIVKVAHHGSPDQSAELYRQLGATLAVISVGADNTYGHPDEKTLDELTAAGSRTLRTDLRGMILISTRNGDFEVWSQKSVGDSGGG